MDGVLINTGSVEPIRTFKLLIRLLIRLAIRTYKKVRYMSALLSSSVASDREAHIIRTAGFLSFTRRNCGPGINVLKVAPQL